MDLNLKGKNVLVAASSKGIGKAVAEQFASEGANVMICSRNTDTLITAAEDLRQRFDTNIYDKKADLSRKEDIEELVQAAVAAFGGIDVVVTNAGGPPSGTFEDTDDALWEQAFNQNLMSVIRLIRCTLPFLRESDSARIVNIASTSVKQPIDGLILSNTFRAGIAGLAKTLSNELAPYGILINTVAPGRIATDRTLYLDRLKSDILNTNVEDIRTQSEKAIPLSRYGQPDELAKMVVFLCSQANTYTTGQTVVVDGGMVKSI
ncbi:3-oxoacyl-ACP reductase [Bacillus sp. FJAT-27264]|uniref:SDR family oxidoreductase n=1 Tax=Paenibacillus sp. (strain DSM 101736 / FJAT-27264) TaxID=1850362 RepID=UPI000807B5A1|nr:SDR family oxidoreductase [Bacillus sp. FJAT-27264]OBZ14242.1 3-oxoacyl-ACP reductase [Bacillus sp. FJAT-27264]